MSVDSGELAKLKISIEASVDKLNKDIQGIKTKIEKDAAEIEKKAGGKLTSMFNNVGSSITAAFTTAAIVKFGFDAVQLAGKVEGVKRAFVNLNQPGLLDKLREATRGTVSDFELMQVAMRASNFKIPLTELATLLEFAKKRATQTGQAVDYLVNSIIDGIGRKSTLVLDNLGISATELQQEFAKTGDFGKATANIIEREMKKMGDVVETSADSMARLNAEIENQKAALGKDLLPLWSGLLTVLGLTVKGLDILRKGMSGDFLDKQAIEDQFILLQQTKNILAQNDKLLTSFTQALKGNFTQSTESVGQVKSKIDELVASQDNLVYGSEQYLKVQKEIEKLEKSIGLGKDKKEPKKPKVYKPDEIDARHLGFSEEGMKTIEEWLSKRNAITKIKNGEMQLQMKEVNAGILDNSMMTTDAIFEDWKKNNEEIVNDFETVSAVAMRGFDEIRIRAAASATATTRFFVDMGNIILNKLKEIIAQMIAMAALKFIFNIVTGGASAAIPGAHTGGNFIGTSNGVKKMAGGGSFIVPSGFPNDSYPLLVESGERVSVTSNNQMNLERRLLNSIDKKLNGLAILNSNFLDNSMRKSKQDVIPIEGEIGDNVILLSSKRAQKVKSRMSI